MLPSTASDTHPTRDSLHALYSWFLDAGPAKRLEYRAARLAMLESPLTAGSMRLSSSGSTGDSKAYDWGPNYEEFYAFVLDLVRQGGDCPLVCSVILSTIRPRDGGTNQSTRLPGGLTVQCTYSVNVYGRGPIPGMDLAGYDLAIAPSFFLLLGEYTDFLDLIDPEALILFTAEALPQEATDLAESRGLRWRDWMRCWDGGATFFTCPRGGKHWLDFVADVRLDGQKLVSSDYYNLAQPLRDYHCGDLLTQEPYACACGLTAYRMDFANRAEAIVVRSPNGDVLTYPRFLNMVAEASHRAGVLNSCTTTVGVGRDSIELNLLMRRDGDVDLVRPLIEESCYGLGYDRVVVNHGMNLPPRKIKKIWLF